MEVPVAVSQPVLANMHVSCVPSGERQGYQGLQLRAWIQSTCPGNGAVTQGPRSCLPPRCSRGSFWRAQAGGSLCREQDLKPQAAAEPATAQTKPSLPNTQIWDHMCTDS